MRHPEQSRDARSGCRRSTRHWAVLAFTLGALLIDGLWAAPMPSSRKTREPQFTYVGGTENVLEGCSGTLQLTSEALGFECPPSTITIPYQSIQLMEYRANVSRDVRKLKLNWKMLPLERRSSKNRYFTVVYTISGTTHAIVLEVPPEEMLPYLAEIDLKAGRRVDVERHEEYE
jgi:hypothetical protein